MPLTWRNVDAPDFRSSMQGYEMFSNLLNRATSGLQQGLERFDAVKDKQANTAVAVNLLKYSDPVAYKAALASGDWLAGQSLDRLNSGTIAAAGARSTDLLNQAVGEQNLAVGKYGFDRRQMVDTKLDAAAPALPGAINAARNGQEAFATYVKAHPELAGLPYDQAMGLTRDALGAEQSDVQIDSGRQSYGMNAKRFGWEVEDHQTAQEADKTFMDITQNSFDQETAMARLNSMKGLNPKVYNAIYGRIQSSMPGTPAGDMMSAAVGSGGGGDPTRVITSGGAGNLGIGQVPSSVQTLGQASEFAKSLNARGQESSAMGVYQIVGQTMRGYAPKALGNGWQNQPFNFENQDKIAREIFLDHRGSADALRSQWTSLSPAQAKSLVGKSWEEARIVIAKGESGADPRTLALGQAVVNQGMTNSNMERNSNNINTQYAKAAGDLRSAPEVAADLTAAPGFKGFGLGYITEQIQSIITKSNNNISPAVAAEILKKSVSSSVWSRNLPFAIGGGSDDGTKIDQSKVDALVKGYKQGDVDRAVVANTNSALQGQANQVAAAKYSQAQARYQQGLAAAKRGVAVDLASLQAQVAQAEGVYNATLQGAGADRGVTSFNSPANAPAPRAPQPVAKARPAVDPSRPLFIPGRGPVGNLTPQQQAAQRMLMERYSGRIF